MDSLEGKPNGPIQINFRKIKILINGRSVVPTNLQLILDDDLSISLSWHLKDLLREFSISNEITLVSIDDSTPQQFLIINHNYGFQDGESFVAKPAQEPILVQGVAAHEIHAVLVNAPNLSFKNSSIVFDLGNCHATVKAFEHSRDSFRSLPRYGALKTITHSIHARIVNGHPIEGKEAFNLLSPIASFLGFVKGSRIGIGQIEGIGDAVLPAFREIGFRKSDTLKGSTNWYYPTLDTDLPGLFQQYRLLNANPAGRDTLNRALHYYQASNQSQADATEVAILLSVAGLEALSHYVLSKRADLSKTQLKNSKLSETLRAAYSFLGLTDDPVSQSPALQARIFDSKKPDYDAFRLIADFRNGLVHPIGFKYHGREMFELWLVSQWLIEVTVLRLLDHKGKYQDRRRQIGSWAGALYDMPI